MTPISVERARESAIAARRDELLTVKEYAFLLGQNPRSVYRRIAKRQQPGVVRFGAEIRIDLAIAGHEAPFTRGRPWK